MTTTLLYTIIPDFFSFLIEIQPVIGIRIRRVVAGAVCTLPHPKRMFIIHIWLKEPFLSTGIQSKCKQILMIYTQTKAPTI